MQVPVKLTSSKATLFSFRLDSKISCARQGSTNRGRSGTTIGHRRPFPGSARCDGAGYGRCRLPTAGQDALSQPEDDNQPGGLVRHHGPGPRPSRSDHPSPAVSVARLLDREAVVTRYLALPAEMRRPGSADQAAGVRQGRRANARGVAQPYRSAGR